MTALLIALVGALLLTNLVAWIFVATVNADMKIVQSRAESHCRLMNEAVARAQEARNEVIHWKRLHDSLLKRQQNRRDAAIQSGPLTGVIPDGRD